MSENHIDNGFSREEVVLVRGAKRTDRLVIVDNRSKVWRGEVRKGFVCIGSKLKTNYTLDR